MDERIPGRPQRNGGHERFHPTLMEVMHPPAADRAKQAWRFAAFVRDHNEERPRESLGRQPPARFYRPSPRAIPDRLPEPDYPAEAAVRKMRSNGEIKWRGDMIHICGALAGDAIAETETGDWRVCFFDTPLCVIDAHN